MCYHYFYGEIKLENIVIICSYVRKLKYRIQKKPTSDVVENERHLMKLYGVRVPVREVGFDPITVGTFDDMAAAVLNKFDATMHSTGHCYRPSFIYYFY